MKKFAVVCGPGRSGTSLATKLVSSCGFNFGKCLPPNKEGSLRHGYGEHSLTNAQGTDIDAAIDKLEAEGASACKLIHLYAQWIPKLQSRGYEVYIVVTSRDVNEIWASGMDIYPNWRPNAIGAICGTADRILKETQRYLKSKKYKAYHLPFGKVVRRDNTTLKGLCDFLGDGDVGILKSIIRPEIVQHDKLAKQKQ